tara:strand:+ start:113 stop:1225 length:1113 start_codon:yes stop_codon:yes gene_type:complete
MNKKKIVFCAPRLHTNYYSLLKILKKNYDIYFVAKYKGNIENYSNLKPKIFKKNIITNLIEIFISDKDKKNLVYLPNFFEFYYYLKKINPDIIILRLSGRLFIYFVIILSIILNKKIALHSQTDLKFFNNKKKGIKSFLKFIELKIILIISKGIYFSPIGEIDRTETFDKYNYLPFTYKIKKKTNTIKSIKILTNAKIQKRKRVELLINALVSLNKNIYLTIIFQKDQNSDHQYYKKIRSLIIKKKLSKRVKVFFNINHSKINSFYQNHDIFVLPAEDEPGSISVVEAICQGLPTICSDTCGTKSYIKNNINGFVFKSGSLNGLLSSLKKITKKKEILRMRKNCFKISSKYLDARNILEIFKKNIVEKLI